ncbi:MAG: energy transducer TonB [Gammaproteobacteria bacterium]|nr:energy transducer TonB [Gammaproteobacteria bacterium]NVK89399.1 energy transducer TonB [Gammaproteobacteria bacterium]
MQRVLIGLALGSGITFGLFILMSVLVQNEGGRVEKTDYSAIDYGSLEIDRQVKRKERRAPKKPPPPKEPPPPETQKVSKVTKPTVTQMNIQLSKLDVNVQGEGMFIGSMEQMMTQDGEAIPLMIIEPQYPRKAAMDGITGYVRFRFTVKADGYPKDVEIVDANPRRVFDREARRAIYRWKFKPKVVDGKAVEQPNMYYTLEFKLAQ